VPVDGRDTTDAFKSFWAVAFLNPNNELNEITVNQQIFKILIFIILNFEFTNLTILKKAL
jgi:hypothetical protein